MHHISTSVRGPPAEQNRVANVLRSWLDVHFMVDQDLPILDKLDFFASTTMIDNIGSEMLSMLSKTLLNLVTRRVSFPLLCLNQLLATSLLFLCLTAVYYRSDRLSVEAKTPINAGSSLEVSFPHLLLYFHVRLRRIFN